MRTNWPTGPSGELVTNSLSRSHPDLQRGLMLLQCLPLDGRYSCTARGITVPRKKILLPQLSTMGTVWCWSSSPRHLVSLTARVLIIPLSLPLFPVCPSTIIYPIKITKKASLTKCAWQYFSQLYPIHFDWIVTSAQRDTKLQLKTIFLEAKDYLKVASMRGK